MSFIRTRSAAAMMASGAAYAGTGVVQIVHSQRGAGEDVVGVAGYLSLGLFAVALILSAAGFLGLGERARSEKGAVVAAIGCLALGITCLTSIVNSHDLPFFVVVAPITNAMWLFGSIALAVSLKRAGRVPKAVYWGLPLVWIGGIPLSTFGGGLIAGAYLLATGYLFASEERDAGAVPAGARA
jgi:hypothetical protein